MAEVTWRLEDPRGQHHELRVGDGVTHHVIWSIDGREVARKRTMEDKFTLAAEKDSYEGVLSFRFGFNGQPQRVTLHDAADRPTNTLSASLGRGGSDFPAPPGSSAERRERRMREHPRRHALFAALGASSTLILGAVGGVIFALIVPMLLRLLPDLHVPLPDLPDIPWPDLPSIPWPEWELPGWVGQILATARYVVPVLIAVAIARAEVRRRRDQDARRTKDQEADA